MTLKELKTYINSFPDGKEFNYSLSDPFSWRGSYDEVSFDVLQEKSTKEELLARIQMAYDQKFFGYKGGEFVYQDYTEVHFERDYSSYTDGGYTEHLIHMIEGNYKPVDPKERLVKLAFS